ncbi:MAG: MSMEG_4193 family putative phosphomutase [Nocardioidaceae bacterium]|nr:MSMEG_4193 family putative phosphomutase [Nocardioidaceae bacterium]
MTTVILVRHGRTAANADGILAGHTPGVGLDDTGAAQAAAVAHRLSALPLAEVVTSPLDRTLQTAAEIGKAQNPERRPRCESDLIECGYGSWTGQSLKVLAKSPLWRTVQLHPSAVRFPEGESMPEMQLRAVAALRRWDGAIGDEHGPQAVWAAVSHGDVIKSVLADALGVHLDSFQRIVVGPGSVSVIQYTDLRPFVLHVNDLGTDLAGLKPPKRRSRRRRSSDAEIGGGSGAA